MFSEVHKRAKKSGQPPGTPTYTGKENFVSPSLTVTTYNTQSCHRINNATLEECLLQQPAQTITWIDVQGLHDGPLIEKICHHFNLHPLTTEDILNVEQRPKVEEFDGYLFITLKILAWHTKKSAFIIKQLSLVLGSDFVLSFHETAFTLFDAIHARLSSNPNQRLRQQGSDYLIYRLIDSVVDEYFIVLEALGDQIEQVEDNIIFSPNPQNARTIYRLKRQMLLLRKAVWPMREAISHLLHVEDTLISKFTRTYMRDVYDHTVQAIDTIETFRDMLSSMLDMYLSSLTNHMNEIMKTLTIITTIFIPITAIASIYGMNFSYIPGLHWQYGYPLTMVVMGMIALGMTIYFKKKKWI